MAIDLSRLSQVNEKVLVHPRDIYAALPYRPWTYLRLEQGEVLEKWFNRRSDRDVVIKQNTGGGKTVVGLLAAQSSINEGIGPVAYFASDTYLVEQVIKEATALGIRTTDNPRDPGFLSHKTILVSTLTRLINGKSVFGVDGGTGAFIELGTVIVDDAHAALSSVEQQFRLTANSTEAFYQAILTLFEEDLAKQSGPVLAEIKAGYPTALLRVPFWSWREKQSTVVQLAVDEHKRRTEAEAAKWKAGRRDEKADQFLFQWPLVKDQLHLSIPTITGTYVEIQPPCPPIHKIPSYATARRRIYLTATLADDAVLVTDLDADPALIAEAVTPGRASDIGDRMILAPLELNPSQDRQGIRELAHSYANGRPGPDGIPTAEKVNVVVIVPSEKAAADWVNVADKVWNVDDLKAGVKALKAGHVGLVVLANKYDGIDLAGSACRLLIIDGLPRTLNARERREASSSLKTHKSLARQVQRVEQGMGRGVRDANDYCAVLLVGDDITRAVHDPKQRAMFSPATRVQLDISRQLAEQLQGAGMKAIYDAIDLCLNRDQSWIEIGRGALARTDYDSAAVLRAEEISARKAFARAVVGDYRGAVDELQVAANAMKSPSERGWIMEQKANYVDFYNAAQAQQALLAASIQNHHVLRPIAGMEGRYMSTDSGPMAVSVPSSRSQPGMRLEEEAVMEREATRRQRPRAERAGANVEL